MKLHLLQQYNLEQVRQDLGKDDYLVLISCNFRKNVRASGISCVSSSIVNWILCDSENKPALQRQNTGQ